MNSNRSRSTSWRRTATGFVAGGAIAAGLLIGAGTVPALAEPAPDPASDTAAPEAPQMTPDQALVAISDKYDTGQGGGQVANLIHDVMTLRQQGFTPSRSNGEALIEALQFNGASQAKLVAALEATRSFQLKNKMRQQQAESQQGPSSIGINTLPPGIQRSNLPPG